MMQQPDEQTMNLEIPLGFRFKPTEYQLLNYFLNQKICDEELPPYTHIFINDVDLYKHHPFYFFQDVMQFGIGEREIRGYFFTKLKKAGTKSSEENSNYNRRVYDDYGTEYGTWNGESRHPILDIDGNQIGYDKYLKFSEVGDEKSKKYSKNPNNNNEVITVEKPKPKLKFEWKMHEYSFLPDFMPACSKEEYKDFVICRIDMKIKGNENAVKRRSSTKNKALEVFFLYELKLTYDNVKSMITTAPSSLPQVDNPTMPAIMSTEEDYGEEPVCKKQKTGHHGIIV
ncbi:NAC domain-containing protein 7-like [Spinacia oleracea]|uniref:NAC domain-containing protein 7-like n=1 Tax=Spinacia oleracea TaxID=3562 RepID=A0A9R0IHJ5_SPIOL|nr:NAC domain-containing protein 7-like [Spinacia oleracea]